MRRSALITAVVLGALVCLLGGTVLYAGLQDTARSGTNSAESAALGTSADIQLAVGALSSSGPGIDCGTFSENLSSGLFTATGLTPGYSSPVQLFCIKNVGSQQVTLSVLADELTDVDFACTGDEAANGDTTCGGDQAGELSIVLRTGYLRQPCENATGGSLPGPILHDHPTTAVALGTLAPAATACFMTSFGYPGGSLTPVADVQKAQSDRATWRIKFSAQA
jgi:hypothetical protein